MPVEADVNPLESVTLWSMLPGRDDLATKTDLSALDNSLRGEIAGVREELKGEMAELRSDLASMRSEMEHRFEGMENRSEGMEHRFATKDDLFAVMNHSNEAMRGYVRTFIVVQAATVVGMSAILFGLLRFF